METLLKYIAPIVVSAFWGLSTPFLRKESKGIEHIHDPSKSYLLNWLNELKFMFLNYKYLIAFLCNQLGSICFVVLLGDNELSVIVPLVNSLTFVFVFIGDVILKEASINRFTVSGILFIATGITICIYSKV